MSFSQYLSKMHILMSFKGVTYLLSKLVRNHHVIFSVEEQYWCRDIPEVHITLEPKSVVKHWIYEEEVEPGQPLEQLEREGDI